MLVYYKVGNFLSFDEPVTLRLLEERKTTRHVSHIAEQAGVRCLRGAAIYGANASGKSNLVKSMLYLWRAMAGNDCSILDGMQYAMRDKVSPAMSWEIGFTAENDLFVYSVSTDGDAVLEESLKRMAETEEVIFARTEKDGVRLGELLSSDPWFDTKVKGSAFFLRKFEADGLFERKDETPASTIIKDVISSFMSVEVLPADSMVRAESLARNLKIAQFKSFLSRLMRTADVGISDVKWVSLPKGNRISEMARFHLSEKALKTDGVKFFRARGEFVAVVVQDGEARFSVLKFMHGKVAMRARNESDGTLKLLNYSVFLYSLRYDSKLWVVDEIDRSLHPFLTRFVIEESLNHPGCTSQLIVTTHDTTILSQALWRTDEVWFTEKRPTGSTDLYSLYQFKPRFDVDLEKRYLEGRWGAIPYLGKGIDDVCEKTEEDE